MNEILIIVITVIGNIIVALIGLLGLVKSSKIKISTDLIVYRIDSLEKKVEKQDELENTIILLRSQIDDMKIQIQDLKRKVEK